MRGCGSKSRAKRNLQGVGWKLPVGAAGSCSSLLSMGGSAGGGQLQPTALAVRSEQLQHPAVCIFLSAIENRYCSKNLLLLQGKNPSLNNSINSDPKNET